MISKLVCLSLCAILCSQKESPLHLKFDIDISDTNQKDLDQPIHMSFDLTDSET